MALSFKIKRVVSIPSLVEEYDRPVHRVSLEGVRRDITVRVWPPDAWSSKVEARLTADLFVRYVSHSWAVGRAVELRAHTVAIV